MAFGKLETVRALEAEIENWRRSYNSLELKFMAFVNSESRKELDGKCRRLTEANARLVKDASDLRLQVHALELERDILKLQYAALVRHINGQH
jgi:predicted  nucleic acid-binding Zn-ribbon protein